MQVPNDKLTPEERKQVSQYVLRHLVSTKDDIPKLVEAHGLEMAFLVFGASVLSKLVREKPEEDARAILKILNTADGRLPGILTSGNEIIRP